MRNLPLLDVSATRRPNRPLLERNPAVKRSTSAQDNSQQHARSVRARIEADPFNVLVLNYTMKCPLACDFCCYACNPGRKETMDLGLALNLVDQASDLGVFQQAGFTGGEPLLFKDEIFTVAKRLSSYSLPFSMISSCQWASTEKETGEMIDGLADLGMSVLSISHDPSHGKWVDPKNVRRAVSHLISRDIPAVICASFYDAKEHLSSTFPEFVDHPMVELVDRVVLPVGSSKQMDLTAKSYGLNQNVDSFACYKRIYHDVTFFWDGEAYPCCSVYNRATKGLSLGNAYDKSLAEIWDSVEGSLMYRVMKGQGFTKLYQIIEEYDPGLYAQLPDRELALGPCQLCNQIFSSRELSAGVQRVFTAYESRQISELLDTIERLAGEESVQRVLQEVNDQEEQGKVP